MSDEIKLDPKMIEEIAKSTQDDNIVPFTPPDRSGEMPSDRSGNRAARRALTRQEQKEARAQQEEAKKIQRQLAQPVTQQQFQQQMMRMLALFNALENENRKLNLTLQAVKRILVDRGVYTVDEFKKEAEVQIAWNNQITDILRGFGSKPQLPIREACALIHQWNESEAGAKLKIDWNHVDLAPRLLDDETLTTEEKIEIAAEMDMPEQFIEGLRQQAAPPSAAEPAE